MSTGTSYPVGRGSSVCAATGRALVEGEAVEATLVEYPADGRLERQDFSIAAWKAGARPGPALHLLGHWRTAARSGPERRVALDDDAMLDMVEQFAGSDDRARGLRLVLALMLVQRRVLVQVGTQGGALLLRKRGLPPPPEGPEPLRVEDPGLDEATLADVAAELEALAAPGPPAAPAPPAAGATP